MLVYLGRQCATSISVVVTMYASLVVIFYADDGVVASKDPIWLQLELDMLTGLFDWVGLQTNIRKTVGMVYRPCWVARVLADEAYTRRMKGEGKSFKEQHRERVLCPECGKYLAKGSLVTHRQTQHSVSKRGLGSERDKADGVYKPRTYIMAFHTREGTRPCPVEGCSGRALTRTANRVHLWQWHVRDTVVIL